MDGGQWLVVVGGRWFLAMARRWSEMGRRCELGFQVLGRERKGDRRREKMLYAANEMIGCPWSFHSNPLSFGFGQPCLSSCCERNWSTYIFVHSLRRNKITPQRVKDLMFIHNNLRLLSRKMSIYKEGETKMWVVRDDGFDTMNMKNAVYSKLQTFHLMNQN
ncbi:hypothetical protein GBA52_014615 [Prunus armeniaca]|nr:hypothetical protein GBA52_014615 [Prunus armeniaca]